MFWPGGECLAIVWSVFWTFQLFSPFFFTTFRTWFGLPHPLIASVPQCVCTHPINLIGIHLLHCVHDNEHIGTHVAIHNNFDAITWDVSFHMKWNQLHAFLSITFNSSCWQVNIVLTKDDIRTLVDVVIDDPLWTNLKPQSCATQRFVTFNVVQAKERSYHNRHPLINFSP